MAVKLIIEDDEPDNSGHQPDKDKSAQDRMDVGGSLQRKVASPSKPIGGKAAEQASIKMLAEQLDELGYHPVILFGSSNSGKTSMLLSLFASVSTRVELHSSIHLNNNIISGDTSYGDYLRKSAQDFLQSKLTNFIEGRAADQTTIPLPFFIPVDFTSSTEEVVKIAFMEGNGEWFKPHRADDGSIHSASLNPAIELFMRSFQGGISFIYLLPYTQREIGQSDGYSAGEDLARKDAGLAIKAVADQYRDIRAGFTSEDRHLLLVTKWDARFDPRSSSGERLTDILGEGIEEVKHYLESNVNYRSAIVAFQSIADVKAKNVRNYCSGRMRGGDIDWPHPEHDHFDLINQFPVELWRWIYSGGLGLEGSNPFPVERKPWWDLGKIREIIGKVIG